MSFLLVAVLVVFGVGYLIGLAVFSNSASKEIAAFFCGLGAVFLVGGIVFAGQVAGDTPV